MKSILLAAGLLVLLGAFAFLFLFDPAGPAGAMNEDPASAAAQAGPGAASGSDPSARAAEPGTTRSAIQAGDAASVPVSTARLIFDGPSAVITARLVDGKGKPAGGAEARVQRASEESHGWMTAPPESEDESAWPAIAADAAGRVSVEVPAGIGLRVDFGGAFWRTQERGLQPLRAGEVADFGELALTSATLLVGRITGEDGAPLAGASVQLRAADAGEFWEGHSLLQGVDSDAEGIVRFPGVPRGRVRVEANAARHVLGVIEALEVSGAGEEQSFSLTLERGATLSGRVVDTDRRAIAGAAIYLIHQKETEYYWGDYLPPVPDREPDAVSDADGAFRVEGLPRLAPGAPSRSLLIAQAEEVGTGAARQVRAGEAATITIPRGARASGIVVDARGEPLPGATVILQQQTPWGWTDQKASIATDADGRFTTPLVPPGQYEVLVSASIGGMAAMPLDLLRDVRDLRLRVDRDRLLSILVLDPDGLPVPHARVEAHTPGASGPGQTFSISTDDVVLAHPSGIGWSGSAEADEHGRAVFREPPSAEIELAVSAQGWARRQQRLLSTGGDQEETITLERPGTLVVLVRDGAGQSVRGVSIRVRDPERGVEARTQNTDHLGRAVWRDLAPGQWEVSHDAGGGAEDAGNFFSHGLALSGEAGDAGQAQEAPGAAVKIVAGEQTEHEILLDDLAMLTVRVLRGGAPAPDVLVRLQRKQPEGEYYTGWNSGEARGVRTDARGVAVLAPVGAGEYELVAKTGRNTPETKQALDLHAGPQERELALNGAEVRGMLRDLRGPLAGARVTLSPHLPDAEQKNGGASIGIMSSSDGSFTIAFGDSSGDSSASSDQYGEYLFQDVPEGQWVVSARHKGVGPWTSLPFTVTGDRPVRLPEHAMLPGAVLHGHDQNWTGPKPDAERFQFDWNASVRVETAAGRIVGMSKADERGEWRVEDLEEGIYVVIRGSWRSEPIQLSPGEVQRQDIPKQEPEASPGG